MGSARPLAPWSPFRTLVTGPRCPIDFDLCLLRRHLPFFCVFEVFAPSMRALVPLTTRAVDIRFGSLTCASLFAVFDSLSIVVYFVLDSLLFHFGARACVRLTSPIQTPLFVRIRDPVPSLPFSFSALYLSLLLSLILMCFSLGVSHVRDHGRRCRCRHWHYHSPLRQQQLLPVSLSSFSLFFSFNLLHNNLLPSSLLHHGRLVLASLHHFF